MRILWHRHFGGRICMVRGLVDHSTAVTVSCVLVQDHNAIQVAVFYLKQSKSRYELYSSCPIGWNRPCCLPHLTHPSSCRSWIGSCAGFGARQYSHGVAGRLLQASCAAFGAASISMVGVAAVADIKKKRGVGIRSDIPGRR